jgi:hypothetical protein
MDSKRVQMETMESTMTDNQFMIHIMNNLPSEYDVSASLLGRWIGKKDGGLTIEEMRSGLSLEYDRLQDRKNVGRSGTKSTLYGGE